MRRTTLAAVVLLAALGFAVSCSRMPSDEAISTDVKAGLFSDSTLKSANIDVAVKDGVVTLSGGVSDEAARSAAERIVRGIKGVRDVNDQIVVASAQSEAPRVAENPPAPEPAKPEPAPRHRPVKHAPRTASEPPQAAPAPAPAATETASQPPAPAAPPAAAPPRPQFRTISIPASTVVTVRTIDSIDSGTNKAGEVFRASLDAPISVDNEVVAPAGSDAFIKLVNAQAQGRYSGRNELTLELSGIVIHGKTYNVVSTDVRQSGNSRGKNSAEKIGGGAAIGAIIGAIAGGGKGAAIGAAVGGAGGAGLQGLRKGKDLKIPSETRLDFTLQQPVEITLRSDS